MAAHFVLDVRRREQHLRHGVVVFGKQLVVGVHQLALAHGRGGLLGGHVRGARPELQLAHAHADGARGNQHDLVPGILQVRQCFAQCFHQADVQTSGFVGKRGSAHLYDNSHQKKPPTHSYFPQHGPNLPARTAVLPRKRTGCAQPRQRRFWGYYSMTPRSGPNKTARTAVLHAAMFPKPRAGARKRTECAQPRQRRFWGYYSIKKPGKQKIL